MCILCHCLVCGYILACTSLENELRTSPALLLSILYKERGCAFDPYLYNIGIPPQINPTAISDTLMIEGLQKMYIFTIMMGVQSTDIHPGSQADGRRLHLNNRARSKVSRV